MHFHKYQGLGLFKYLSISIICCAIYQADENNRHFFKEIGFSNNYLALGMIQKQLRKPQILKSRKMFYQSNIKNFVKSQIRSFRIGFGSGEQI